MDIEPTQITTIKQVLSRAQKIIITAHQKPDPDAICSTIAMCMWIQQNYPGISAEIYFEDNFANDTFEYIPQLDLIKKTANLTTVVDNKATLVILDCPDTYRVTNFVSNLSAKEILLIDHHPLMETHVTHKYTEESASSACEIISSKFCTNEDLNNRILCEVLLQGILADAGGITYIGKRNSQALLEMKRLIDLGDIDQIENLQNKATQFFEEELEAYKFYVKNTTNVAITNGPSLTYSYLTKAEYNSLDAKFIKSARAKYLSAIIRKIKSHPWGFIVTPNPEEKTFGISLRANVGSVNVLDIAKQFDGGGHQMAAAGNYTPTENEENVDSPEVVQKILQEINHMDLSNYTSS